MNLAAITQLPTILAILLFYLSMPAMVSAEEASQLLADLVRGNEGSRTLAASRLYHLGEAGRGVPLLAPRLRHEDPVERCLTARLLGMLRDRRATRPLVAVLDDEDGAVRRNAVEALGQIGDATASSALNRALEDSVPDVRIAAARALREIGVTGALPAALGRESSPEVRLHLVEALARDSSLRAGRALSEALEDESELVRLLAASYLIERGVETALEVIAPRLRHEHDTARREAAEALGHATGAVASQARELLLPLLGDPSHRVMLTAATSLAALDDPRGVAHLRSLVRSSAPPAIRAEALELLERLGSGTETP